MARMTEKDKQKDRARKIKVLTDAAMEWLKKHRKPWQVVGETPADTLHLAGLMADFAADTLLRHDDNLDDHDSELAEAYNTAKKFLKACMYSARTSGTEEKKYLFRDMSVEELEIICHAMVIYARLDRYDREQIRTDKKAVI